jgi:hypothetical protein
MCRLPMTPVDEQLCRLLRAAVKARTHQFALNLVTSLDTINSMAGPTPEQAEKVAAADSACIEADNALSDYQAAQRSSQKNA